MSDDKRSGGDGRKPPRGPKRPFSGGRGPSRGGDDRPKRFAAPDGDAPPRRAFAGRSAGERPDRDNRPRTAPSDNENAGRRTFEPRFEDRREKRPARPPRTEGEARPPRREEGDRPPRRFDSERPARKFEGGDRPPRREEGDRPPRRFDSERPARKFEGGDRPPRREEGDRSPRRFDSERPARKFESGDRPPRREEGDRPPRRFDSERPARKFEGGDRPPRREEGDRPPRRFDSERPARKFEGGDRPPRRDQGDRPPRKFGGERPRAPVVRERPAIAVAETTSAFEGDRVAKVIARSGLGSRRDVETWIEQGRVAVNGEVLESAARNVTAGDKVTVDGAPLPRRERTRLWLYHKPRGLVTTEKDPEGRPTVFENLPAGLPRVLSVGRLDINTEGLLLLTNDGGLARQLELPKTGWLRRYRVRAHGETDQAVLDQLASGVTVDGIEYGPIEARLDKEQGENAWLTLGLREGKNREVKNVLGSIGLEVNRLIRVSYGPFQLGDLAEGTVEEVKTRVLAEQLGTDLAEEAECDFEAPIFERPVEPPKPVDKRRGLRVKSEDGETDRIMRGGLVEDRRGRRVLVQRVSDVEEEKPQRQSRAPRPWSERGERPPFAPRPERAGETGDRPFKPRRFGDRNEGGDRPFKPRFERSEGGDRGDRPFKPRFERSEGGDRGDRPFKPRFERSEGGDRGDRPFKPRFERSEGGDRGERPFKPRFERSEGGDRGERPFKPRFERSEGGDRGERPFKPRFGGGGKPGGFGDRPGGGFRGKPGGGGGFRGKPGGGGGPPRGRGPKRDRD